MEVSGTQSSLQTNSVKNSNDNDHKHSSTTTGKKGSESGDFVLSSSKHRASSPAPFALHTDGNNSNRNGLHMKNGASAAPMKSSALATNANTPSLRAPYAQPVLDASKLHSTKKINTSVNERISSARERRQQQQQIIDESLNARRMKEEASRAKWEEGRDEKKKKLEELKEKEMLRRKEVEERKHKQLQEEKKRAEAIVARTDQQSEVVMRKKRSSSVDKTKRWSWGAGGYGGGGGVSTQATHVSTAPSPFHYFDATQLTKRVPSHDHQNRRRPLSMDVSSFVVPNGDEDEDRNSISTSTSIMGPNKTEAGSLFSKSPLVMDTTHMKFASGLRSYGSSPTQSLDKSASPGKNRRSRSVDTRKHKRSLSKDSLQSVDKTAPTDLSSARGRSPAARESPKSKGHSSPQTMEPINISTRLLAPTKASIARSKHEPEESHVSTHANNPLRSRSIDRKRPSSVKSDVSSSSSTVSSPRVQIDKPTTKSKSGLARDPSPSVEKKQKPHSPKTQSLITDSNRPRSQPSLSRPRRAASPIPSSSTPKEVKKRSPSPFKPSPGSNKSSSSNTKSTPAREAAPSSKSTPPVIKQTLRPTNSRPKSSLSPAAIARSLSNKLSRKTTKQPEKAVKKSNVDTTVTLPSGHDDKPESVEELNKTFTVSTLLDTTVSHKATPGTAVMNDSSKEELANETKSQANSNQFSIESTNSSSIEVLNKEVIASDPSSQEQSAVGSDLAPIASSSLEDDNKDAVILDTDAEDDALHLSQDHTKETLSVLTPANSLADEIHVTLTTNQDQVAHIEDEEISSVIVGATNDETPSPKNDEEIDEKPTKEEQSNFAPIMQTPEEPTPEEQTDMKAVELSEKAIVEAQEEIQDEDQASRDRSTIQQEELASADADDTNQTDEADQAPPADQAELLSEADNPSATICDKQEVDEESLETNESSQSKASPNVEVKPSEDEQSQKINSTEKAASSEDQKKKEKKLSPEEQAYKDAIAAKRREMKEKREREERERQERLKLEAEEQAKREEDARRMAEEARIEQEKIEEEERLKKEELEKKRKMEAEEIARKHEEFVREQREKAEQKAREEAEKLRKDREIASQKKDEERLARKKRLEMIMRRTRGGDSPPSNVSNSNTPTGGQSPANVTPIGGRSPHSLSPATVEARAGEEPSSTLQVSNLAGVQQVLSETHVAPSSGDSASTDIATIPLEESSNPQVNGSHPPQQPFIAFEDKVRVNGSLQNNFVPIDVANLTPSNDPDAAASLLLKTSNHVGLESGESLNHPLSTPVEDKNDVPTGNLLDL